MQRPWMTDTMPWEQSLSQWQATLPLWLRQLVELTPAERKERLAALGWYGLPKLRRQIIRGDFAQLKTDHEAQVRAWLDIQAATSQAQFELRLKPPSEPNPIESAFWRRPELAHQFKTFWTEIDARAAAEEAQVAAAHAEAAKWGFCYPVDSTQGVPLEEALAWTVGCCGRNKKGYKTVEGFRAWLGTVGYCYLDTGRITQKGFALALQRDRVQQRAYKTGWKRANRPPGNPPPANKQRKLPKRITRSK
jgi:hypothetical protein